MTWRSARSSPTNAASSQPIPRRSSSSAKPRASRAADLEHLVHPKLARPRRRGLGVAAAHPHHRDARGPHQHEAEAVLNVEPLELDRSVRRSGPTKIPLSVSTPSTSSPRRRIRRASAGSIMRAAPTDRGSAPTSSSSRSSGHWVAASLSARGGIGMRLEEEAVGARHGRGREQRRDVFALATAGAARALPRLLHGVGRVEDHRRARGRAEPARNSACPPRGRRSRRRCRAR